MPTLPRSPLLAFAFIAFAFGCGGARPPGLSSPAASGPPVRLVDLPSPLRRASARPVRLPTTGERAATIALEAVGVPYRWGGASPAGGFDCSGLVYWAYGRLGIELPHSSYALYEQGQRIARSSMKPGDLLFFYGLGHVGIYIGRDRMVHAPRSGRLVEVVNLDRSNYGSRLVGVRRIVS